MAAMPKITSICKEALSRLKGDWAAIVFCTLAFIWLPVLPLLYDGPIHEIFEIDYGEKIPILENLHIVLPLELIIILLLTTLLIIFPLTLGYQCTLLKYMRNDTAAPSYSMLLVFKHRYDRWLLASFLFCVIVYVVPELIQILGLDLWIDYLKTLDVTDAIWAQIIFVALVLAVFLLTSVLLSFFALMPYIVHDNKETPVLKCLKQSLVLSKGHRCKIFLINLLFYGPMMLLSVLLFVLFGEQIINKSIWLICELALSIIYLFVTPLMLSVLALFYNHLIENQKSNQ